MEEKRKRNPWLTWLVVGLMLLVAYPLSSGPVAWLEVHGNLSPNTRQFLWEFYAPVGFACNNGPPQVRQFLTWWTHLFVR